MGNAQERRHKIKLGIPKESLIEMRSNRQPASTTLCSQKQEFFERDFLFEFEFEFENVLIPLPTYKSSKPPLSPPFLT